MKRDKVAFNSVTGTKRSQTDKADAVESVQKENHTGQECAIWAEEGNYF